MIQVVSVVMSASQDERACKGVAESYFNVEIEFLVAGGSLQTLVRAGGACPGAGTC